jgi:putative ABC transport system permease protein
MRAFSVALRSLLRQPGRTLLGVVGIAAVGALLFDMLLLSRGLLVSLRTLLDAAGYDVRVISTETLPLMGPPIGNADAAVAGLARLPAVDEVVPLRFGVATARAADGRTLDVSFTGIDPGRRKPWRLVAGEELRPSDAVPGLLVNQNLADALRVSIGGRVSLRTACSREDPVLPSSEFRLAGIAEFPFDESSALTAVSRLADFRRACGLPDQDEADLLLVAASESAGGAEAVRAIRAYRPDLHAFTNEELVERFQQLGFSYFRQISNVLSSITLFFAFLLITVLLTVSVNQRLGEIAALRALGLSRGRVVADVFWQSALLVGGGGVLSVPLGWALSRWLDTILRAMPEIPKDAHFFLFEPRALVVHALLLAVTALLAAAYPMRLVARLPIAETLRKEVVT